ncbi:MAG TPA: methyl-accepting chemotaxis protein, partial [Turneriella sp.]|nr:methyl-accepting chemotaxis protein [Turneriella sp.]
MTATNSATKFDSNALEKRIVILYSLGFIMPPSVWMVSLLLTGVIENISELVAIVTGPVMNLYILTYMILVVLSVRRSLKRIRGVDASSSPGVIDNAAKAARSLPRSFILFMLVYCVLGPSSSFFRKDFISPTEYLLGELIAMPLIFLFAIPFLIAIVTATEKITIRVPLDNRHNFYSVGTKMFFFSSVSAFGGLLFLSIAAAALYTKRQVIGTDFDLFIRLIIFFVLAIVIVFFNLAQLRFQISGPIKQLQERLGEISSAHADLTQRIHTHSRDEFGFAAHAFNTFVQRLSHVLKDIREFSTLIQTASGLLSQTSAELFSASQTQKERLQSSQKHITSVFTAVEENS